MSGNSYDIENSGIEVLQSDTHIVSPQYMETTLCPYIQSTITRSDGSVSCKYGERCQYQHGDLCELCGLHCLHPTDQKQRKAHEKVCCNAFILSKNFRFLFLHPPSIYLFNRR